PNLVPFIEQAIDDAAEPGTDVQKVGYGEDDSELGGAFIQDNTPVFQATVQDDHYWRGEAKDTYTGKGWIHSREDEEIQQTDGHISLNLFSDRVETTERQATVNLQPEVETDYIFYPYGMKTIHSSSNAQVTLGSESEALRAWLDGAPTHLSSYDLEY